MSCTEEHEQIQTKLDGIIADLEYHIADAHSKLLPKEEILTKEEALAADNHLQQTLDTLATESATDRAEIHRQLDEMGEVVLGEKHLDFDGNTVRSGGMKAMVDLEPGMAAMVAQNENGGLRFKYANLIIGALVIVISGLIGLATTVLTHSSDTAQVIEQVMENVNNRLDEIVQYEEQENTP